LGRLSTGEEKTSTKPEKGDAGRSLCLGAQGVMGGKKIGGGNGHNGKKSLVMGKVTKTRN